MSEPVLLVEKGTRSRSGIATITLNRPKALNALSRELRAEIAGAFRHLASDGETRVIILTGSGRAFCAGLDLKELSGEVSSNDSAITDQDMLESIGAFAGPIIGAINGFAITGGFELGHVASQVASGHARLVLEVDEVGLLEDCKMRQQRQSGRLMNHPVDRLKGLRSCGRGGASRQRLRPHGVGRSG